MFSQESVLLNNGFNYVGQCKCGGRLQYKYMRNGELLRVFPTKNNFKFKLRYHALSVLEEVITAEN